MPGGAGLVAIKYTKNPKDVAAVMDYLASEPVLKEFTEQTLFVPGHKGLLAGTLDFKTDNEQVKAALRSSSPRPPRPPPSRTSWRAGSGPIPTTVPW